MKPIIDAHLHLDCQKSDPVCDLLRNMDSMCIEKAMLILNLPCEREALYKDFDCYRNNAKRFWLASGINIHDSLSLSEFFKLEEMSGDSVYVKIHPNLFHIQENEISKVIESLSNIHRTIIIDSLYYGANIESHIGVKLGVLMARSYPDRKIVMAHSGSLDFLKCMMATRYLPNVFYDYSFIVPFFSKTSLRLDMVDFLRRTSNRIMFGSDFPSFGINKVLEEFEFLVDEAQLTLEQRDSVMNGNAKKIYGSF